MALYPKQKFNCEECCDEGWDLVDVGSYDDMQVVWIVCPVCKNPLRKAKPE